MTPSSDTEEPATDSRVITVAVCTFNRHQLLVENMNGLFQQTLAKDRFAVLIVDNSTDREVAQTFYDRNNLGIAVRVIWSSPPGLSRARNQAIAACQTPYIAFLDDDAIPDPGWLAALIEGFENDAHVGVVGGPIRPIWSKERPAWLPDAHLGMLTVLDLAAEDTDLAPGSYLYGANMAFRVDALRDAGCFPEQIGRMGSGSLLSNEELHVQDLIRARGLTVRYVKGASVRHHVHEDRLRPNWMRSRMAWQAVSEHLSDPPQFAKNWIVEELRNFAGKDKEIASAVCALLSPASGERLSAQLSAIHHIVGLLLGVHTLESDDLRSFVSTMEDKAPSTHRTTTATHKDQYLPITDSYAPSSAGGASARYLFVEGAPGHQFLYDLFGDIPGSHLVTYPATDAWCADASSVAAFKQDLAFVYRSIGSAARAIFFLTLDQALGGAQYEELLRFVAASPIPVHGILHRLPEKQPDIENIRRLARFGGKICFLSEVITEEARSVLEIWNAQYLPLHPASFPYPCSPDRRTALRARLGVRPSHTVFSVIGEARHGKGIDLLLESLRYLPAAVRSKMFFLIAGKARHYTGDDLRERLLLSHTAGAIDVRQGGDDFHYAVLTGREYADYIAATDVGLLLYQEDERHCMSGVLGDYVWAKRPVVATGSSYTGSEVQRNDLGIVLRSESPEAVAVSLVEALRLSEHYEGLSGVASSYRERIAPDAVLWRLQNILDPTEATNSSLNEVATEVT